MSLIRRGPEVPKGSARTDHGIASVLRQEWFLQCCWKSKRRCRHALYDVEILLWR